MIKQIFVKFSLMAAVLFLSGCASWFFPDFDEGKDIVIDDGGKVEVRKVEGKGILVADKANALYEGEEDNDVASESNEDEDEDEKVEAAKVVPVRAENVPVTVKVVKKAPAKAVDNVKIVEGESPDAAVIQRPTMHYLAGIIYFANGTSNIDGENSAKLKKIAQTAKQNKAKVEVYGFASSRTRNMDPVAHKLANFKVSSQRAENTAAALRNFGVKAENIEVQAMSDSMPMYKEVMPEGERLNRRAEIYLTY